MRHLPKFATIGTLLAFTCYLLVFPTPSRSISSSLVLSEIQLAETGTGQTTNEFIEIYNTSNQELALSGYRLARKTAAVDAVEEDILADFGSVSIQPHSYFLVAHTNFAGTGLPGADLTYSDTSVATNNTVLLYDNSDTLVDKVGLGDTNDKETTTAPNPANGKSIERKAVVDSTADSMTSGADMLLGNGFDSDNNLNDFVVRDEPQPQNSNSDPEPSSLPTASPSPTTEITESPTPTLSPSPTESLTPTPTDTLTPTPTDEVSPTPTVEVTLTPSPTPTPGGPMNRVLAQYAFFGKTTTCRINYSLRNFGRLLQLWLPAISCETTVTL